MNRNYLVLRQFRGKCFIHFKWKPYYMSFRRPKGGRISCTSTLCYRDYSLTLWMTINLKAFTAPKLTQNQLLSKSHVTHCTDIINRWISMSPSDMNLFFSCHWCHCSKSGVTWVTCVFACHVTWGCWYSENCSIRAMSDMCFWCLKKIRKRKCLP